MELVRNMHKIIATSCRLWGGSVTRLTGRREPVHVGLTIDPLDNKGVEVMGVGPRICLE